MPSRGHPSFDWSGDEVLFCIAAIGVAVVTLRSLAGDLFGVQPLHRASAGRRVVRWGLVAGAGASLPVLLVWADPVHVAGHLDYTLLFMTGAAAWVGTVGRLMPWLGLSIRDDVSERANLAAAVPAAAALLAAGLIYALSNIGRGDAIWTTLVPAAVATGLWLILWLLLAAATGVNDRVAIDRDPAVGGRLAAYLLASAIIIGASAAGDFAGYWPAFADLARVGWPAGAVWLLAGVAERWYRPTPDRPVGRVPADVVPTVLGHLVLTAIALAWRVARG